MSYKDLVKARADRIAKEAAKEANGKEDAVGSRSLRQKQRKPL